jgi:hypothetical protein
LEELNTDVLKHFTIIGKDVLAVSGQPQQSFVAFTLNSLL